MRIVSDDFRRAAFGESTTDYLIILLTLNHPSFAEPIRVSSDNTARLEVLPTGVIYGTVSRGDTYYFFPFQLTLPTDQEGALPRGSLAIDNVSRELTETIRSIGDPLTVDIELVLSSDLDHVEVQFMQFELVRVSYDDSVITGELVLDNLEGEAYPAMRFDPVRFPGLF